MANKTWVGGDGAGTTSYAVAANWSASGVPSAGDHVRITPDSTYSIAAGLNQSAVAIGDFIVNAGYAGTIGSQTAGYLQIDPDRFEFSGEAESWIDIGSANILAQVFRTAAAATGKRALYLKGSNILSLNVVGRSRVGVAYRHGETSTLATARVAHADGDLVIGAGTTFTTLDVLAGTATLRAAATTVTLYGGTFTSEEIGAITTLTQHAGTATLNSTGTVTTVNLNGGILDLSKSGASRTITTLNHNGGTLILNPAVTISTYNRPTKTGQLIYA